MSLVTRCPHCKTVFQVNEEQLKLRSGTVRCGVCHSLFNGIDNFIGRIALKETIHQQEHQEKRPLETGDKPSSENITNHDALKEAFNKQLQTISLDLNDFPANGNTTGFKESPRTNGNIPFAVTSENTSTDDDQTTNSGKKELKSSEKTAFSPTLSRSDQEYRTENISLPSNDTSNDQIKIVQQKKRIFWAFWSIGVILLVLLLCGQIFYFYSERIVSWWPATKNLVDSTCKILACPVNSPSEPSSLHMEYGELTAIEDLPNRYTQRVTITNRSSSQQLFPSLVMEITDAEHHLLSRRRLEPEEYFPEKSSIVKGLAPSEKIDFQLDFEYPHDTAINSRIILFNH